MLSITKGRRCFSVFSAKPGTSGPSPFSQGLSPFRAILHYPSQQQQRMRWLDGITDAIDISLSKLRELGMVRKVWHTAVHGFSKSWISLSDWTELILLIRERSPEVILKEAEKLIKITWDQIRGVEALHSPALSLSAAFSLHPCYKTAHQIIPCWGV